MKRFLFLLLFVTAFISSSCTTQTKDAAQEQPLKLTLRFEKTEYHVGDPVIATVKLENIGSVPIIINSRMLAGLPFMPPQTCEIVFDVLDPSGKSYWPSVNLDPGGLYNTDFVELKPGDSIEEEIHLDSYGYVFTKVGIYMVVAKYQNAIDPKDANSLKDVEDNRIAWKGIINSAQLQLKIIP